MVTKETPNLFESERVVEITKEQAPWAPEEELGTYNAKRWTWFGKQKALIGSAIILDKERGFAESDLAEYYARMVLTCVTPPEPLSDAWNLEKVKGLDPNVGEILKDACREINGLVWEEKASFLGQSEAKKDTPG